MPKKPETKIIKQGKVDTEEIPLIKEKPRIVFRLFECLVHLEQAEQHLDKVGILVGQEPLLLLDRIKRITAEITEIKRTYNQRWCDEQKGI